MNSNLLSTVFAASLLLIFGAGNAIGQINNQRRSVAVDAMARDAIFNEDDVIVADMRASKFDGFFDESIAVSATTITGFTTASANQMSFIDTQAAEFFADSEIETISQEDGASGNSAASRFSLRFQVFNGGTLELSDLTLMAVRADIGASGQGVEVERSDDALLLVQVNRRGFVFPVLQRGIRFERGDEQAGSSEQLSINLPPGIYLLTIRSIIFGDDGFNNVQGQPRGSRLKFTVDGRIIEQP